MTSTVVVKEKRGVIEKFRNWYKTNYIDTGKAQDFEKKIDKNIQTTKNVVYVAGAICTVVLAIIPAEGPVGEAIALIATPALAKAVEAGGELFKDAVIGVKRGIEDNIVHADGKSDVKIASSVDEIIGHAKSAADAATSVKDTAHSIHNQNKTYNYDEDEVIDVDYEVVEEERSRGL